MGEAKRRKANLGDAYGKTAKGLEIVQVNDYLHLPAMLVDAWHEGMQQLAAEAMKIEPPREGAFTRRAAAVHEAAHCIVAKREGRQPTRASIWQVNGAWLGDFWTAGGMEEIDMMSAASAAPRIRITLAGRRGELLYAPKFSVYAGMDELVWCQTVVMPLVCVHADAKPSVPEDEHYSIVWGSILSAVDETLREHKSEVLSIADELERTGAVEHVWLAQAIAGVQPRTGEPLVPCDEHRIAPGDPLA